MFGKPIKVIKPEPRPGRHVGIRDVVGAKPYEFGIIAKYPGDNWKYMQMLRDQRKGQALGKDKEMEIKNAHNDIVRQEFDLLTDKKGLMNRLKHQVKAGLEAAKRDLEVRRQKLRCMFLEEEAAMTREYVDRCQKYHDKKFEEMKQKALDLRNQLEIERKQMVHEKRIQQYIERCEDLRSMRSKKECQLVRQAQEYQMKEKEMKKLQELEENKMWAAVAMKEYEAKVEREIEEARDKFRRDREAAEIIVSQQKALEADTNAVKKEVLNQEAIMIKNIEEQLKREKIEELEQKLKKREQIYRDLKEQIERREQFLGQLAKEEKLQDDVFNKLAQIEYEREMTGIQDVREQLKRESQLYRDNLAELRRLRALEELELEKILKQEKEKVDAERRERALRLKAAREKLKNEVLSGRKEQVARRLADAEELKRAEEREVKLTNQLRDMNQRLEREHDEQLKILKRRYAKDLLDQIEYVKTLKERERAEIEREYRAGLLEEECYRRLIKELLSRHEELEPHPFYRVIQASVSLDGPCLCPVPEATEDNAQKR